MSSCDAHVHLQQACWTQPKKSSETVTGSKKKRRGPRRANKPVDVAFPIETDGEVALFFSLHNDPACKNRDGSDNFITMAARFNTAFYKQVRATQII